MLNGTGRETFEAVKMLKSANPQRYTPAAGANYPKGRFGDAMRQTAQLIKSKLGVQIAFTDISGWDHHVNEGAGEGQLANVLRDFSQSIAAFWIDLGPLASDTVLVSMSEFGRTARENGNRGPITVTPTSCSCSVARCAAGGSMVAGQGWILRS